jgi:hypothetical protein
MAFGIFTVPIQDGGRAQEELNAFLRSHQILSVDRRRVAIPDGSASTGSGGRPEGSDRVNRGGSWNNHGTNCQAANRNRTTPTNRNNNNGVRLARAPREQRTLDRPEPAALPFHRGFGSGGQKDRGPPGVSSRRERSGWPFCLSPADRPRPSEKLE